MMERVPQPVREMLALLRESGHTPYLVGGCVRDLLRGAEPDDYDMTSDARPEEVMTIFGADAHPTGLMHGTVTLVRGGLPSSTRPSAATEPTATAVTPRACALQAASKRILPAAILQ
ncbi:MAG: hypothetical protein ACLS8S_02545 [Oscillospiraceae bacterium]